ncbi:MAG TPA: PRC-barrel domain-containing protein [Burkholderiaceae bacterium]|nr:PRC-barrel domain-containing protein [Burkholderiaceae bacterium]
MRKTLIAAASVLALTGTTAFAQTATPGNDARAQPGATTGTSGMGAAAPTATTKRETPTIARASRLIGGDVENPQGDNIGKIRDMVIDPSTGQIQQVVVGVGGFLGIGEKDVALQWDGLQIEQEVREVAPRSPAATGTPPAAPAPASRADGTPAPGTSTATPAEPAVVATGRPRIVVSMTKEQLEQAPAFRFDDEKAVSGSATTAPSAPAGATGAAGTMGTTGSGTTR